MSERKIKPEIPQEWLDETIKQQKKTSNTTYEIEIRFKSYRLDGFKYGVSYDDFDRLRTYMVSQNYTLSIIHQIDESQSIKLGYDREGKVIKGTIRRTIMKGKEDVWIGKRLQPGLNKIDDQEYYLRYTFNTEGIILKQAKFKKETVREKTRWSYLMKGNRLRADLTKVIMTIGDVKFPPSYEVELEVVDANISLNDISDSITEIFKVLHDTERIYTIGEYKNLVFFVNQTLRQNSPDRNFPVISHWGLFQARNLHYRDMAMGGLIGHSSFQKNGITTLTYSVTIKADGIRKLFVISQIGIWLVMSKDKVNLVFRIQPGDFHDKIGYILEGELIPSERRRKVLGMDGKVAKSPPTSKYWYLVYDCLAMPYKDVRSSPTIKYGNPTIQEYPHSERMEEGQNLINYIQGRLPNDNTLLINSKRFIGFNTGYQLSEVIRKLKLSMSNRLYKNDGFIFTPEEMPYNFKVKVKGQKDKQNIWSLPLHMRVLTKYPDICKWKPAEDLTIDFQIRLKGENTIELFVGLPKNVRVEGNAELFRGTNIYPFPVDRSGNVELATKESIVNGLPDGTIVEYKWDYSKRLMIPIRIRDDKQRPNLKRFADDTWNLIQNPISLDTLEGRDFKLMFKYHNRIKRNLFQTAYQSLKTRHGPKSFLTALDIGSGPGGDTTKLKMFDRIIFLEPDAQYLNELSLRIRGVYGQTIVEIITTQDNIMNKIQIALNRRDRAIILNTGGENSPLIKAVVKAWLGGPASLISIMLSMSFFWSSPQKIKALETTIVENLSPDGEGIFFTIDGELVRHAFNPVLQTNGIRIGGQKEAIDYVKFGDAILKYSAKESKLEISIPSSIVDRQTEYPPYLADLGPGLKARGWKISHLERADQELFLNVGETELSKLYMSGRILPKNFIEPKLIISRRTTTRRNKTRETTQRRVSQNAPQIRIPRRSRSIIPPKTPVPRIRAKPRLVKSPAKSIQFIKYNNLPMIVGDDNVEQIVVPWYEALAVVRIGTIGDGSCFFHALLKAFYVPYANNNNYSFRVNLVRKLRRDMAASLEIKDPASREGKTFYQTAANGSWVRLSEQQRLGANLGFDPSLLAIQTRLNSKVDVGDEVYQFVGDLLGINIYVVKATRNNLEPILNTSIKGRYQPSVVIAGNGLHYETVGIYSGPKVGIQTVFYPNDPFLIALRGQIDDIEGDTN